LNVCSWLPSFVSGFIAFASFDNDYVAKNSNWV